MAVRKDQYQLSVEFITDESKRLAKTLNETKKFQNEIFGLNKRIEKYQKDLAKTNLTEEQRQVLMTKLSKAQTELADNLKKVAAAGKRVEGIDLTKLTPSQLIQRARQLSQIMRLIPQSAPQYQQLETELKQVNDQLATMRQRTKGISDSVKQGFTARLGELLRNPLAIVGGIAAITSAAMNAVREVSRIVDEVGNLRREISQLTSLSGNELDIFTTKVRGMSKTFNQSENEILRTANTLVKEFDITYDQALAKIEDGFLRGADASGEFLDNLREYSTQFRSAGFSAQEFINLSVRAQQEGIFSDKGLDVVKEFGLRIREQTKAVRDAMENAFGKKFSERIFSGINDGSITTQEALRDIVKEMKNTEIPAAQLQTVIADVFAAPGEDAGLRFLMTLDDTQVALSDISVEADNYRIAQEQLLRSNEDLAAAENELAKDLFKLDNGFNVFWTRMKTLGISTLSNVIEYFEEFPAVFKGISASFKQFFENLKLTFTGRPDETKGLGRAYREAYLEGLEPIKTQREIANALKADREELLEDAKKKSQNTGNSADDKATERERNALERRRERLLEILKGFKREEEIIELSAEERKIELLKDKFQKAIDEAKALERAGIKQATSIAIELERQKIEAVGRLRTELYTEFFEKEQAYLQELEDERTIKQLERAEQRKEAERKIANELFSITLSERELALRDLEEHQNQLLMLAQKHGLDVLDIEIAFRKEKAKINKKYDDEEKNKAIKTQQERAEGLAGTFGALSSVFGSALAASKKDGEEFNDFTRALALSQIALSAAQAIAQATASSSSVPFPGNIAAIATAVATVLSQIAAAQKMFSSAPKLARGGYTGQGIGPRDESGHRPAGIVHDGEWVAPSWMVQRHGNTISALESIRRRGYATGGFVDTTPVAAAAPVGSPDMEARQEARALRMEFAQLRKDLNTWQRNLKVNVRYQDVEDAGRTLNSIRADASL